MLRGRGTDELAAQRATGLPVFSIYTFLQWFQQSLMPDRFAGGVDDPLF